VDVSRETGLTLPLLTGPVNGQLVAGRIARRILARETGHTLTQF